ncbi:hypothetical protein GJAV_G00192400 [Gymnothorax javanicus]|nr:hypothetical protein GJAV_G00192400 [Gymnothorax javanicus]
MPNRLPLREVLSVGLNFVVFLGETDRYSIRDKEQLREIYYSEFRNRDGKKHPNFSRLLYALRRFRKAKVRSGIVRFKTLPLNTFDGLLTSPGYAQAEDKALYVLSSLAVTDLEKQQIEEATVGQAKNPLWSAYRKGRVTASNFGSVLAAVRRKSYPLSFFKTLLGQCNLEGSEACEWGNLHEPTAKQDYTKRTGAVIQERGLFLSNSGLLGGSPDGTVSNDCIIEVKCPWSARNKTVLQAAESRDFFLELDKVTASLKLKQTHNYWHQIQGNLHLTKANSCDLVVWTSLDFVILPVLKDPSWAGNIDILETFYRDCFLPHILSQL